MSRKYNQKEMVLRYIVALTEIKKNYVKHGKFWHLSESTQKQGIGTIPKDCLFDLTDQIEITEEYVNKVLKRRVKHEADYRSKHQKDHPVAQTIFDTMSDEPDPEVVQTLDDDTCIQYLKSRGYSISKQF